MSDPGQFNEIISQWSFLSVPLGVFIASLLGSSHCVTMCGPIAVTVNNNFGYMSLYHVGRLMSYLALGALAGLIGETFLSTNYPIITTVSAIMISAFLIYTGYKLITGKPLELIPSKMISSILRLPAKWSLTQTKPVASLTLGVVNGFIPCGWVYIFVIGSVAAKSPLYGAAILFIFWLGTIPALSAFPFIFKKGISRAPRKLGLIAGIILILVGLINFSVHLLPLENTHHAHQIHNTR